MADQILKNEIDEGYRSVQLTMKTSLEKLLAGLTEAEFIKKPKELINGVVEERLNGRVSKNFAAEIVDIIYQQDSPIKQEIRDAVEARINLENSSLRKKFDNQRGR